MSGPIRVLRANCDSADCTIECRDDEVLLTAYCGARRSAATHPTERSASCRRRGNQNSPLVVACGKVSSDTSSAARTTGTGATGTGATGTGATAQDTKRNNNSSDAEMDRRLRDICRGC